jgi:hypothetical protein
MAHTNSYHATIWLAALLRAFHAQIGRLNHDYEAIPPLGHCRSRNAYEAVADVLAGVVPTSVAGATTRLI